MIEIKNISNREINGIPKEEYWVQMQVQMETCDLDECDFVETRFKEFKSEEEFYESFKGVTEFGSSPSKEAENDSSPVLLSDAPDKNHSPSLHSGEFSNSPLVLRTSGDFPEIAKENEKNEIKPYEYVGVILYFIDKITTINSVPHYVYLPPFSQDCEVKTREHVNKMIDEKIKTFKESEEGIGKILYEKIYWYLDQYSCVLVKRNKMWFEQVLPKIVEVSQIIEKERVEGFEHRASNRLKVKQNT
jgi:hypothetical protein